ncbi:hypothetical protein [Aeropyrum camini]|uniref:hypothetical protein n=1 Tax=Aeropyrum camini TaxID=229980 RepID=UPI000787E369|nr:hypothetical protein [Aeropyrum camini]
MYKAGFIGFENPAQESYLLDHLKLSRKLSAVACNPIILALSMIEGSVVARVKGKTLTSLIPLVEKQLSHPSGEANAILIVVNGDSGKRLHIILDRRERRLGLCLKELGSFMNDPSIEKRAAVKGLKALANYLSNITGDVLIVTVPKSVLKI